MAALSFLMRASMWLWKESKTSFCSGEKEREETTVRHLTNLIKNKKFSVEEALITLEIPEEQWDSLKEKIK